jgi:hypothetical protein
MDVPEPLIIGVVVLVVGSVAASFVDRVGAPTLLVFLGLGMLLGEDGPGGIQFNDAVLARDAGLVALAVILFEGGVLADLPEVRRVWARRGAGDAGSAHHRAGGGRGHAGRGRFRLGDVVAVGRIRGIHRRRRRVRGREGATCAAGWPRSWRPRAVSTTPSRRCW